MSNTDQKSPFFPVNLNNSFGFTLDQPGSFQNNPNLNENFANLMAEANSEMVSFVTNRLTEDFSFPSKIAACRTPADFASAQLGFWQKMFHDYSHENQKLWAMTMEALQSSNGHSSSSVKNGSPSRRSRRRS